MRTELTAEEEGFEETANTLVSLLAGSGGKIGRPHGLLVVHTVLVVQHRTDGLTSPGPDRLRGIVDAVHEYHGEPEGVQATMEMAEAVLDDSITIDGEVSS